MWPALEAASISSSYRSAGFSVGMFEHGRDISEQGRVPPEIANWRLQATGNSNPQKRLLCDSGERANVSFGLGPGLATGTCR